MASDPQAPTAACFVNAATALTTTDFGAVAPTPQPADVRAIAADAANQAIENR